jgi:hypothetical protein
VGSGVALVLNGTLTGENDECSGILLEGGATGVAVSNGRIQGFSVGVNGDSLGAVDGNRFADLRIHGGFAGVVLTGDDNAVEGNVVIDALVAGILLNGNRNTASLNRAEGTALFGLAILGGDAVVSRNVALQNGGDGIAVAGDNAVLTGNRAAYNGSAGFVLDGAGLTVTGNVAAANGLDGFAVFAGDSTFERNRGDHNGGFGIVELEPAIPPTNVYRSDRCTGNALGPSNPPGLCR